MVRKMGWSQAEAEEVANDCVGKWPEPNVAKVAAKVVSGGDTLTPETIVVIENVLAEQKRTNKQLAEMERKTREAGNRKEEERKEMQRALELSLQGWKSQLQQQERKIKSNHSEFLKPFAEAVNDKHRMGLLEVEIAEFKMKMEEEESKRRRAVHKAGELASEITETSGRNKARRRSRTCGAGSGRYL